MSDSTDGGAADECKRLWRLVPVPVIVSVVCTTSWFGKAAITHEALHRHSPLPLSPSTCTTSLQPVHKIHARPSMSGHCMNMVQLISLHYAYGPTTPAKRYSKKQACSHESCCKARRRPVWSNASCNDTCPCHLATSSKEAVARSLHSFQSLLRRAWQRQLCSN